MLTLALEVDDCGLATGGYTWRMKLSLRAGLIGFWFGLALIVSGCNTAGPASSYSSRRPLLGTTNQPATPPPPATPAATAPASQ